MTKRDNQTRPCKHGDCKGIQIYRPDWDTWYDRWKCETCGAEDLELKE
jgi:hypothetical protein